VSRRVSRVHDEEVAVVGEDTGRGVEHVGRFRVADQEGLADVETERAAAGDQFDLHDGLGGSVLHAARHWAAAIVDML